MVTPNLVAALQRLREFGSGLGAGSPRWQQDSSSGEDEVGREEGDWHRVKRKRGYNEDEDGKEEENQHEVKRKRGYSEEEDGKEEENQPGGKQEEGCIGEADDGLLWENDSERKRADAEHLLWIDAICINQDDLDERSQQVRLMKNIYSTAGRVLVWLGEQQPLTREALQLLVPLSRLEIARPKKQFNLSLLSEEEKALGKERLQDGTLFGDVLCHPLWMVFVDLFLNCTVFTRVWTIQEVVLALEHRVFVFCGGVRLLWSRFSGIVKLVTRCKFVFDSFEGRIRPLVEKIFAGTVARGKIQAIPEGYPTFRYVIAAAISSQATDGRDRVFGILGLVDE